MLPRRQLGFSLITSTDAKFLPRTLLFCLPSHQKSAGLHMCASVPKFTWVLGIQTQVLTELSPPTPQLINCRKMANKTCNNCFWRKLGAVCSEHGKAQRPERSSVIGDYYPTMYTLGWAPEMPSQSLPDPLYALEVPLIHWASLSMSPLGICVLWRWSHSQAPFCCLPCTQIHIRNTVCPKKSSWRQTCIEDFADNRPFSKHVTVFHTARSFKQLPKIKLNPRSRSPWGFYRTLHNMPGYMFF